MSRSEFLFRFVAIFLLLVFSTGLSQATEPWKFGVIPDTQWNSMDEPFNGVAIHIIDAVVAEMIRQKVDLVVHTGDLTDRSTQKGFDTAAARFKPLTDNGIGFYPVRGNHDIRGGLEVVEQYKMAFPDRPGEPGRKGTSPDLPGIEGLTYAFTHKNIKFVMLDIFPVKGKDGDEIDYKPGDFQPWIDKELDAKDYRHAIVVSHKNLIGQNHKDNLFSSRSPNRYPEMQNRFFKSLADHGVRLYLSGHDHLYYRARIWSVDRESEVMQIICGACAHKFYSPREPFSLRDVPLAQELNRVGFMIFTVTDDGITGEYYSTEPFGAEPKKPKWNLRERFGYTKDGKYFEEQNVPMKDFLRYKLVP